MKRESTSRRKALTSTAALSAVAALSCGSSASADDRMMTNRALIRAFTDTLTAHNLDGFKSLYSPHYVQHQVLAIASPHLNARDAVVAYFAKRIEGFPDLVVTSDAALAEGDLICANFIYTGTHKGEYLGIEATGKRVSFNSTDIMKVSGGQFVEHWGAADLAGLTQQLRP